MSREGVPATPQAWSFAVAPLPVGKTAAPRVVSVEPATDSEVTLLTELKVKFDQPMDPSWYGIVSSDTGPMRSGPAIMRIATYDPERRQFTLPVLMPSNWYGKIRLEGFRNSEGTPAEPITLKYRTLRQPIAESMQSRIRAEGQSPELRRLVEQILAARRNLKSVEETAQDVMVYGWSPGWSQQYRSTKAVFRIQNERQFYANIDDIMNIPFRIGSDGQTCWFRGDHDLYSLPFEQIDEKNLLIADPFGATRAKDAGEVIEHLRLAYLGKAEVEGRPCHKIRSWGIGVDRDGDTSPIQDWYFDSATFLPVRLESMTRDFLIANTYVYTHVNEPIPDERFRVESAPDLVQKAPEPLTKGYTQRYLIIHDGSNGRMSVRWGMHGPQGSSSSGLN
jgi:hypothetical protein